MSQITTLTNHRSPQNQPHYFIRTHHLNRRPLCWSHQNKGSINQDCHKRFYRHMFFWFIYFFTFETSGTASCGTTGKPQNLLKISTLKTQIDDAAVPLTTNTGKRRDKHWPKEGLSQEGFSLQKPPSPNNLAELKPGQPESLFKFTERL